MNEVVIVDAVRTPIGSYKGALKDVRPDDLGAIVIRALIERNPGVRPDEIDDVIFGNANGAGEENRNVGRMSALLAGLPQSVGGTTLNRLCGSGLDSVSMAARSILAGEVDVVIAGGTESMTRAPFVMKKPETEFPRGNMEMLDTTLGWRFVNPKLHDMYGSDAMAETAENVAKRFKINRLSQDEFAVNSQELFDVKVPKSYGKPMQLSNLIIYFNNLTTKGFTYKYDKSEFDFMIIWPIQSVTENIEDFWCQVPTQF